MKWRALIVGVIAAGAVGAEAGAFSVGNVPQVPLEEAPAVAMPAGAPPAPADLLMPPHLAGGFPGPRGWAPDAQGLPTLQDLGAVSPTYVAPPPTRHRGHHHGGRRH